MKSNAKPNSVTRNGNGSSQPPSPSVPISVYRELAAELQATRAMVDSLNAKNQDLTLQNQKLRQEVKRFIQSAMHLQVLVDPTSPGTPNTRPSRPPQANSRPHPESVEPNTPTLAETAAASAIAARLRTPEPAASYEELFTQEQAQPRAAQGRKPRDMSGLWLTFAIVVIMVTAFGAGFLVVRPLLPTSNNSSSDNNSLNSQPNSPTNSNPTNNPTINSPSTSPSNLPNSPNP